MSVIRLVGRICVGVVFSAAAAGCVVVPYGYGHGRYGRGDRYYGPPPAQRPIIIETPQGPPAPRWRP
jgi:hypothetical protein